MNFGERLRETRKKQGHTLEKVAQDLGKTKATLSRYENGQTEPKLKFIKKLANYYNTTHFCN